MVKVVEFKGKVTPAGGGEVNLFDFHDVRNNVGEKHLIVKNSGTQSAIIRYYYADMKEVYPLQKSIDTDAENLVPAGTTKHILLEDSWMVEAVKATAILSGAEGAVLEGKFIAPPSKFMSDTEKE